MITLFYGPNAALRAHPELHAPGALVMPCSRAFPVPWRGVRALLPQLRARAGSGTAKLDAAIARHRAALGLVLRRIALDADERAAQREIEARPLGFLSHNPAMTWPLSLAWIEVVAAALEEGDAPVVIVPDASACDSESFVVLRHLLVRGVRADLDLRCGFAEDAPSHGLVNERTSFLGAGHVAALEAIPGTRVVHLEATEGASPSSTRAGLALDPLDDDGERRAFDELTATPTPDAATIARAMDAMRASFGAFGFAAVIALGLEVLARAGDRLAPEERAEAHTLVGLAAYNRQVESAGDPGLAEFLEEHFGAALSLERDAGRRSHLLYRATINAGRRREQFDEALAHAAAAIEAAHEPSVPSGLGAFLEAWARNGRAYVLARLRRTDEALADVETGFAGLDAAEGSKDVGKLELEYTRVVLADNLAEVASRAKKPEVARRWQARLTALESALFGGASFSPWRWLALEREAHELRAAIGYAERGLAGARERMDPLAEDAFGAALADLAYRAGDAVRAYEAFDGVLAIRRRVGRAEDVLAAEIGCALAAMRDGRSDAARDHLARGFATSAAEGDAARASLLALGALVEARAGDAGAADAAGNEAIAAAVACGERDVLARVARSIGQACVALGRDDEARAAFTQALEIAADAPSCAADIAASHLGLARLDGEEHAARALATFPAALADAEAWWLLPDLLRHAPAKEVGAVRRAATQRDDCAALV